MTAAADAGWMARAQRLAMRGLYTTEPNPRVGCVLVRDDAAVGEGFHAYAGGPHAEALALQAAGAAARGATAYVTLEPCAHHGRTPPCADALIEAGVARVCYAVDDPNPLAHGGAERLRSAGIEVERLAAGGSEARMLNIGFIKRLRSGRPWISMKLAMSLDGRTALASGESRWITGEAARTDGHRWRARASLILTGRGTVAADDPALTVRLPAGERPGWARPPAVAIVDSTLATPPASQLFDRHERVLIFTRAGAGGAREALVARGAEIVELPGDGNQPQGVEPGALFRALGERGVNEVHVEAGPTLCGRLLDTGYVDELLVYMAPSILGGDARGLFTTSPLAHMAERTRLHWQDIRHVGTDLRIRALPLIDRE